MKHLAIVTALALAACAPDPYSPPPLAADGAAGRPHVWASNKSEDTPEVELSAEALLSCSNATLRNYVWTSIYQTGNWLALSGQICAGDFCYVEARCGIGCSGPATHRLYAYPHTSGQVGRGYAYNLSNGAITNRRACNCSASCGVWE